MPDDAVLERTRAFDPASLSAREARGFVRRILHEAGREEWTEPAELAVSEIVTNAVLHAHTAFDLTVRLSSDHVRVEVRDHNPALPQQRSYDDQATTGRGMALVDAITDAHGITSLGPGGKVVWFCVGAPAVAASTDDLLDRWDDGDWDVTPAPAAPPPADLVDVVLRGMPPTLWLAARQHHDALLRELALHCAEHPDCGVTADDLAGADAARRTITTEVEALQARTRLQRWSAGGLLPVAPTSPATDLHLHVPAGSGRSFSALQDVLDTGERLARAEALLVPPGLPEIVAVRDWACEQVVAQLAGGRPVPWPGADDDRFARAVANDALDAGEEQQRIRESDRRLVTADDANRIVAVSRPLAEVLGYDPDDLVGRRVVAIVPPRYREAHVAGFTRFLATGEAHVLGVELEVPVLRRDGTELTCTLLIEEHGTRSGRRVFTAEITPA